PEATARSRLGSSGSYGANPEGCESHSSTKQSVRSAPLLSSLSVKARNDASLQLATLISAKRTSVSDFATCCTKYVLPLPGAAQIRCALRLPPGCSRPIAML